MTLAFDLLLVLTLVWLAHRSLASPDLFKGVVLFIAFALLLALAWARLRAPDIALAEAAIGSGLTGALLLSTLARLRQMDRLDDRIEPVAEEPRTGWVLRVALGVSLLATMALTGWAVTGLPTGAPGLTATVQEKLAASGVSNPVTAVLLNFRAYDTLLEIAVLLLAVIAVWAIASAEDPSARPGTVPAGQVALVNVLTPILVVTAGYLLWIGTSAPGGAFQAGALLGGAGVLVVLSRPAWVALGDGWRPRVSLTVGLAAFLAAGLLTLVSGRRFLEYPEGWAGTLILLIEAAAALSIGATLMLLFLGGRPPAHLPQLPATPPPEEP